eukprot:gene1850-3594_t
MKHLNSERSGSIKTGSEKGGGEVSDMFRDMSIDGTAGAQGQQQSGRRSNRRTETNGTNPPPVEDRSYEISAQDRKDLKSDTINYDAQRMVGHGSFGVVFQAKVVETNEIVAIKKVLQDRRFKNRELQIMRQLQKQPHPNIVTLKHFFVSKGSKQDDVYLNLVLEFVPETVYSVAKEYSRRKETVPYLVTKLYMYQLSRALGHIHGMGICHRDIKPQNLLVNPAKNVLKLCDFGSAKSLIPGEPNVAYICSRYYRAPELIFGSTEYTTAIDVWSQGCVLAELLTGSPLFPGSSGVDQLVEIIKVLGTPTKDELKAMNPNYQEFRFPQIRAHPWHGVFKPRTPPESIELVGRMLAYVPSTRCKAIESCSHPFFDELRDPNTMQPDGTPIPDYFFQFTAEEAALCPSMATVLVPPHKAAIGGLMRAPPAESAELLESAKFNVISVQSTEGDGLKGDGSV